MAWSSLASNQMVSFTDAQGGGFALQSGQSHVTSNKCMTKSEALAKYVLNASNMSSYASNQLVPKSTWASAAIGYSHHWERYGSTTISAACAATDLSYEFFTVNSTINVGDQVYSNAALTLPISYDQTYFHKLYGTNIICETNVNGVIISINTCPTNIGDIYVYNYSSTTGSIISNIIINGVDINTSGFPLHGGYNLSGTYTSNGTTNNFITVSISTAGLDAPVTLSIPSIGYVSCGTGSSSVDFSNVDLSTSPPIYISMDTDGFSCT